MKTKLSVLFADMRGSAGGVTASKWKGTNYVRSRVTPANPNSAAQQLQRAAFKICVKCWQSLTTAMKDSWESLAASKQMSEFNAFMSANVAQERTNSFSTYTPANALVEAPSTVTVTTGAAIGGEIDITWSQGSAEATDDLALWYRVTETSPATYVEPAGITMATQAYTLASLDFETAYAVGIAAKNAVNGYSLAQGGEATSSAEV